MAATAVKPSILTRQMAILFLLSFCHVNKGDGAVDRGGVHARDRCRRERYGGTGRRLLRGEDSSRSASNSAKKDGRCVSAESATYGLQVKVDVAARGGIIMAAFGSAIRFASPSYVVMMSYRTNCACLGRDATAIECVAHLPQLCESFERCNTACGFAMSTTAAAETTSTAGFLTRAQLADFVYRE